MNTTETRAREMIAASRAADNKSFDWSFRQEVRLVFEAQYAYSFPARRVVRIAAALVDCDETQAYADKISTALSSLVRSKLLRTRMIRGERHYELNF